MIALALASKIDMYGQNPLWFVFKLRAKLSYTLRRDRFRNRISTRDIVRDFWRPLA